MTAGNPIRILVADDHPVVRDGLLAMLGTQPDFKVVAAAGTGREAVERTLAERPDVLLLDLELPELDGAEVLRRLREEHAASRALVFTAYDSDERILTAIRLGAQGYLLKGAPREAVFNAIRVVASGGTLLEPLVALKLVESARRLSGTPDARLTGREIDVLRGLAQGLTNKQIAAQLVVTERTVKFHVSAILAKLGAANRTEAVKIALDDDLIHH